MCRKPSGTFVSISMVVIGVGLMVSALPIWGGSSTTLSAGHQLPDNNALSSPHNIVFSAGDRHLEKCRSAADDRGVEDDHPGEIEKVVGARSDYGFYISGARGGAQQLGPSGATFRLRALWTEILQIVEPRTDRGSLRADGCEQPARDRGDREGGTTGTGTDDRDSAVDR